MSGDQPILARGLTDGEDFLVSAEEPLASLQIECGGTLPGKVAIPALLEAVRKVRRYQIKLARKIDALSSEEAIAAKVEIDLRCDGQAGCEISVLGWQTLPLHAQDDKADAQNRISVDRHMAEFQAVLDADQRLLAVESQASDLAELTALAKEQIGAHWTDLVSIEGVSQTRRIHWRLLDGARVAINGSDRQWQAVLIPNCGEDAEPAGFELLFVPDQPLPRQAAEDTFAGGAEQPRDQLIGQEVAPALRQPISRIIANAETIRARLAGPLADDYAQYASDIANAGQLLLGLLDDLADLEVVEAEGFSTAPDTIDLATVARQAAGILGVRANEKAICIDAPQHGEELWAVAEFRRVLQILINVIGNAIRYAPEDSQILLRLEAHGERARVIVADEGPGIAKDQAEAIFEKFERLGRSDDGGSGLGLYISRRLARAMGGELRVESDEGQGACFILEVPAATGDPKA